MTGLVPTIVGSLIIAAVSTLGDFIWATWIPRHRPVYGLTHGTLLFLAIGLFLGVLARRPGAGALGGAMTGGLAAASYYFLAPLAGYSVMFVVWCGVWVVLAMLYGWLLNGSFHAPGTITRGLIASAGSGLAFYLISGIWRPFHPTGWDYLTHWGAWTVAYFPGFAALLNGKKL